MPGSRNMIEGAMWAAIGLAITGVAYALAPGGYYVLAYGAVLVGGAQLLLGASQYAGHSLRSRNPRASAPDATAAAIGRVMTAVGVANGDFDEAHVRTISQSHRQIFGVELPEDLIRATAAEMRAGNFDLGGELDASSSALQPEMTPLVFQAAYLVATADGRVSDSERSTLARLAASLRMSQADIETALAELRARTERT